MHHLGKKSYPISHLSLANRYFWINLCTTVGFPGGSDSKESTCNAGDLGSIPESGRSLEKEWQPPPGFQPEESLGQKSLAGYSP